MLRRRPTAWWALALTCATPFVAAADLTVHVETAAGAPIADAIVYAVPAAPIHAAPGARYVIDQIDRHFVPRVNVVQAGTAVDFPNSDNIRHSVYSFSPARVFSLKLYAGKPTDPVLFDKAGLVVLGCNIHDSMVAWLLVVDTPYFARTDRAGIALLPKLPSGDYSLRAWHASLTEDEQIVQPLHLEPGAAALAHTLHISAPLDGPESPAKAQ
ncbi:MAG TPA: methylamine utilization protein [Steroidobacteraceae bacterium]|jgi:plastocyanin|nr:methylamine utilization protein [Steroidobacteraceae bacterium]